MSQPLVHRRHALQLALAAWVAPSLARANPPADPPVITQPVPRVPGPKRTVGVGEIDVLGTYANASANNAGGPMAAMLSTGLSESGCCDVVERDVMAQLVTEMDMAKQHVSNGTSAPAPGNMIPAQFLLAGAMTSQSTGDSGGGLNLGGAAGALALGGSHGSVDLDLRLIDTRTGEVVKAIHVRRGINGQTMNLSSSAGGTSIGANGFNNTPMGEALRHAVNDAVIQIAAALAAQPWRGQVVKFDAGAVWANIGANGGMTIGDRLSVERTGEVLTDPATGAVLSETTVKLGVVTITNVEAKISWGTYQPTTPGDPARGDWLVMSPS